MENEKEVQIPKLLYDISILNYDDLTEFLTLKEFFKTQSLKSERHSTSFYQEISKVLQFIDRKADDKEKRSFACGLAFNNYYFCVNTRQLKHFISRCKSSINSGFQNIGYHSLKLKSKSNSLLLSVLPSLSSDVLSSRQWTIRINNNFQFSIVKNIIKKPKQNYPLPFILPQISTNKTEILDNSNDFYNSFISENNSISYQEEEWEFTSNIW